MSRKAMAIVVDPFSFATAELSAEFIRVFPHPNIVPKYLEKVSDKTGVQLLTNLDTVILKGPWIAVERAHSFLVEFLASYQTQNSENRQDETNDDDVLHVDTQSHHTRCGNEESDDDNDAEDHCHVPNVTSFHENTGEISDWIKWTAKILPKIQRTRSKRTNEPKSQANDVPEPLVVYANFQPNPDPAAKKAPTLDAIEEVLKKVYHTHKDKLCISEGHNKSHDSAKETNSCSQQGLGTNVADEPLLTSEKAHDNVLGNTLYSKEESVCSQEQAEHISKEDGSAVTNNNDRNNPKMCVVSQQSVIVATEDHSDNTLQETQVKRKASSELKKTLPQALGAVHFDREETTAPDSNVDYQKAGTVKQTKCDVKLEDNVRPTSQRNKRCAKTSEVGPKTSQTELDTDRQKKSTATKKIRSDNKSSVAQRKSKRKGQPKKSGKLKKCKVEAKQEVPSSSSSLSKEHIEAGHLHKQTRANVRDGPVVKPALEKKKGGRQSCPKTTKSISTSNEKEDFICGLCSYVAKKRSHLREHKRRVHITKEFKCETCQKVFGFKKDLNRHQLTHDKAGNCCDTCGKLYKGLRSLAEHKKVHETDYMKPSFPCEFCQKIFSTKYVLAYHIKSEHLGIKKTYICPTCGKTFSQRNSYMQHANVHMGIKPYQCDICGSSFSYEKSLKEHKYIHEEGKQFECPVCNKKFRQSSGMAIHMKIHKERKDYVCSACGKGFGQKQALIRHERIHVGEKPFSCALCQRKFTDSSILRRHMILIHKKDPKKWREDTENNVQRRTDFFVTVLGTDGKPQKSKAAGGNANQFDNTTAAATSDSGENADQDSHSNVETGQAESENADDSFSFIPVGIGTLPIPQSAIPQTVPSVPTLVDIKMEHMPSQESTMATLTFNDQHASIVSASHKVDADNTGTDFSMVLGPSLLSKQSFQSVNVNGPSHSVNMSPTSHSQAELQQANGSLAFHSSYSTFSNQPRLQPTDYYHDLTQSLQLSQSHLSSAQLSAVLAQGDGSYSHSLGVMPDGDALTFHAESPTSVTAAQSHAPPQAPNYEHLVSHPPMEQHEYSDTKHE